MTTEAPTTTLVRDTFSIETPNEAGAKTSYTGTRFCSRIESCARSCGVLRVAGGWSWSVLFLLCYTASAAYLGYSLYEAIGLWEKPRVSRTTRKH